MATPLDAVEGGIAQVQVRRGHIDLRAQHLGPILELAGAHALEEVQVLFGGTATVGAVGAGMIEVPPIGPHLFRSLLIHIGLAFADQVTCPIEQLLEVVGGVVEVLPPIETQPADVLLDRIREVLLLLGRIGIVETQMAGAPELLGHPEIQADGLGVTHMQITVGLRREAGHDGGMLPGGEVLTDDRTDEIRRAFLFLLAHG